MFPSAFFLTGLLMFAIWFFLRRKAKAAAAWLRTRGRILASKIDRSKDMDGQYTDVFSVVYEYAVNGSGHRGKRVSFGGSGSGSSKEKLARYPAGKEVDVYYDPKDPSSAVLELKLPGNVVILPIVGTAFLVAGVVVSFVA